MKHLLNPFELSGLKLMICAGCWELENGEEIGMLKWALFAGQC